MAARPAQDPGDSPLHDGRRRLRETGNAEIVRRGSFAEQDPIVPFQLPFGDGGTVRYRSTLTQAPPGPSQLKPSPQTAIDLPALVIASSP